MSNLISKRSWKRIAVFSVVEGAVMIALIAARFVDATRILDLGNEFQYNIISMSSIIGGFLFTSISILISVIDNKKIKRYWNYDYLSSLYRVAFIGIISCVAIIVLGLAFLICNLNSTILLWIGRFEIYFIAYSASMFIWSIKEMMCLIRLLKKYNKDDGKTE